MRSGVEQWQHRLHEEQCERERERKRGRGRERRGGERKDCAGLYHSQCS
jgi:hypothetical protein